MDLLLIRHGQSVGNVAGLLNSTEQDSLTDHGFQQAAHLRSTMERFELKADRVYSSPWKRALQTTEVLFHDKCSWNIDPRLGETNPGRFATWKAAEFRETYPEFGKRLSDRYEGGESHLELAARSINWVEEEFLPLADTAGLLVAVCHAGPISVISQYLLSIPLSLFPKVLVPNASLTLFRRNEHAEGFHLQIAGLS
ncbi:histidine phosphatase family protein [Paraburkholderia phenoliruptrix]|uniref:histidine phosphatase family protein n=1 Tax=Paraburkholderia phenoliruptrix TaxID=252970 RepID=UPI002869BD63|nr:histidine phosphatase family protein [Paraburkholderia phenoliruptrix]WMY07505.1 phosphoglycerate mutase family protein [Paraburkholderia phenoliruptrix]